MDDPRTEKPINTFIAMLLLFVGAAVGVWAGILLEDEHKDRQFAAQRMAEADKPPMVIGSGMKLAVPGATVLLGPVTITQNPGHATMPVFVEANDKSQALVCLLLDEKKRLLAGGSIPLPPRLTGTDLNVDFQRKITNGSVQCKLVKP